MYPISPTVEVHQGRIVEDVTITAGLVRLNLFQPKTSSAVGPDGIHPTILQKTSDSLAPQLVTSSERLSIQVSVLKTGPWLMQSQHSRRDAKLTQRTADPSS